MRARGWRRCAFFAPPPCGEGLGVGVRAGRLLVRAPPSPPPPAPPHKGAGSRWRFFADVKHARGSRWRPIAEVWEWVERNSAAPSCRRRRRPSARPPPDRIQVHVELEASTVSMKYITVTSTRLRRYFAFMRHHRNRMYARRQLVHVTGVTNGDRAKQRVGPWIETDSDGTCRFGWRAAAMKNDESNRARRGHAALSARSRARKGRSRFRRHSRLMASAALSWLSA